MSSALAESPTVAEADLEECQKKRETFVENGTQSRAGEDVEVLSLHCSVCTSENVTNSKTRAHNCVREAELAPALFKVLSTNWGDGEKIWVLGAGELMPYVTPR